MQQIVVLAYFNHLETILSTQRVDTWVLRPSECTGDISLMRWSSYFNVKSFDHFNKEAFQLKTWPRDVGLKIVELCYQHDGVFVSCVVSCNFPFKFLMTVKLSSF